MFGKASKLLLAFSILTSVALSPVTVRADQIVGPTAGVQVQNLDTTEATVNIKAVDKNGTTVNGNGAGFNDTIPANGSKTYFPLDSIGLTSGFDGSLVVASSKPVAAIANVLAKSSTNVNTGASYGGVSAAAPSLTLPLIMKNNGANTFDTMFNVQNTGTTPAQVTVTYKPTDASSGNSGCTQTATIPPNAAVTFNQGTDTNFTGCAGLGNRFVGSATVTSSGALVAAALESSKLTLFAYTGFAAGATNPVFPLINANNNGNQTGVQIANLGATDTNVTVTYVPGTAGNACTETRTIGAGSSTTFALDAFVNSNLGAAENCADGVRFIGSAAVTANSANTPLVAIVNQLNNSKSLGAAYGSFDTNAATANVSLPLITDNNGKYQGFTGFAIANVGATATDITCTYSTVAGHTPAPSTATNVAPGSALVVNNNSQLRKDNSTAYVGSANCVASAAGAKIVGVVNQSVNLSQAADGTFAGDKLLVYEGFNK